MQFSNEWAAGTRHGALDKDAILFLPSPGQNTDATSADAHRALFTAMHATARMTVDTICRAFQCPSWRSRISRETVAQVTPQSSGCRFFLLYTKRAKGRPGDRTGPRKIDPTQRRNDRT